MKRFFLLATLALGGCNAVLTANSAAVDQKNIDVAREAYATYLTAAVRYSKLPVCVGVHFTIAAPCHEKSVVASMKKYDTVINADFNQLQAEVSSGSTGNFAGLYSTLMTAINTAQALVPAGV